MNDGGHAFPTSGHPDCIPGMTLRDYFAGQVLNGINASMTDGWPDPELAADRAYEQADSMLAEREKTK